MDANGLSLWKQQKMHEALSSHVEGSTKTDFEMEAKKVITKDEVIDNGESTSTIPLKCNNILNNKQNIHMLAYMKSRMIE